MDIVCLTIFHLLLSKNHIFKSFFLGRVYAGRSNDDLSHLTSSVLMDEFEQSLKSKEDYMNALSHSFEVALQLKVYLQKYALPASSTAPNAVLLQKTDCTGS